MVSHIDTQYISYIYCNVYRQIICPKYTLYIAFTLSKSDIILIAKHNFEHIIGLDFVAVLKSIIGSFKVRIISDHIATCVCYTYMYACSGHLE